MIVEQLEEKIKVLTTNYSNLELDLNSCKTSEKDIIQARTRSQLETKKLEDENLKCRSDNITMRELILELKQNQNKLSSELQTCNDQLKDSIKRKQNLQKKYESVCPSWSEWSSCSKTCWGTKTRTDRCSRSDEQIQACNQFSSCQRSGK